MQKKQFKGFGGSGGGGGKPPETAVSGTIDETWDDYYAALEC